MLLNNRFAAGDNTLRFIVIKARRPYVLLQFLRSSVSEILCGPGLSKEHRCNHVDTCVRTLGGEDRCDQKLKRVREIQSHLRLRIGHVKNRDDLFRAALQRMLRFLGRHRMHQPFGRCDERNASTFLRSHAFTTSLASSHPLRAIPTPY